MSALLSFGLIVKEHHIQFDHLQSYVLNFKLFSVLIVLLISECCNLFCFNFFTLNRSDAKLCTDTVESLTHEVEDLYVASQYRAVTGVLGSHPDCRDVHIDQLSITFYGTELLQDTRLELNNGRRYGLIGLNGCGKCVK